MTLYNYKIGTTYVGLVNLESLTVPVVPPKPTYSPYTSVVELGDGSTKGIGYPIATWHWDFLHRAQRDQLRTLLPGASTEIFIQTYTKDDGTTIKAFSCVAHWPVMSEETQTAKAMDFTIKFTQLVDVTP